MRGANIKFTTVNFKNEISSDIEIITGVIIIFNPEFEQREVFCERRDSPYIWFIFGFLSLKINIILRVI